jgi:bifunctional isochorismate lyase / aryl carrier protein
MSCAEPNLAFARHRRLPEMQFAALVLIDLQRAFVDPQLPTALAGADRALLRAHKLLRGFQRAGRPVAITRHAHCKRPAPGGMGSWWTHFFLDGDPATEIARELLPLGDALLVRKQHYSAFRGTVLQSWLRQRAVRTLVLAGVMTHICVDTTGRDAFMRGFDVVVVHDACASKDQGLHQAALLTMSHAFARVCSTRQVLASLKGAGAS